MLFLASMTASVSCRNVGDVDNASPANTSTRSGDRPCCPWSNLLVFYQKIVIRDYEDADRVMLPRHIFYFVNIFGAPAPRPRLSRLPLSTFKEHRNGATK